MLLAEPATPSGRNLFRAQDGSERAGECPEWQRGRTVNPLAYAFVGSSPTSPTTPRFKKEYCGAPASFGAGIAQW